MLDALLQLVTSAPLHVELWRGPHLESRHVVHAVVADATGAVVRAWGDTGRLTHPRSSVKPIQALPLVESGAADAFGVTDLELALACASHSGEPGHVEAVEAWLARIGCTPDDLECGVEVGKGPTPAGNNCSGKHAGFLTLARHLGVPSAGYIRADHPVQQLVREALADVADVALDPADAGTDGCGIPVHPLPLQALAGAGARFGAPPSHWAPERVEAARRLAAAMVAHPWHVAGTDRLCTDLLAAARGEVLVKVGAEGVQLAALPSQGLGVAVKAEDGATRASEVALGHVLAALGCDAAPVAQVFERRRRITNWAGTHVADLQVVDPAP